MTAKRDCGEGDSARLYIWLGSCLAYLLVTNLATDTRELYLLLAETALLGWNEVRQEHASAGHGCAGVSLTNRRSPDELEPAFGEFA